MAKINDHDWRWRLQRPCQTLSEGADDWCGCRSFRVPVPGSWRSAWTGGCWSAAPGWSWTPASVCSVGTSCSGSTSSPGRSPRRESPAAAGSCASSRAVGTRKWDRFTQMLVINQRGVREWQHKNEKTKLGFESRVCAPSVLSTTRYFFILMFSF